MNQLQRAKHKNILNVIGWTRWEDGVAVIMEYMPGGNIWDLIGTGANTPVSPLLKLSLCKDISSGIAHIHNLLPKAKLVHGDIKPENILLTKQLRCKIADFGGSRLAAEAESVVSLVRGLQSTNTEHCTSIYASPEALKAPLQFLRHTHDIFSFSIVVYEILTGMKPIC